MGKLTRIECIFVCVPYRYPSVARLHDLMQEVQLTVFGSSFPGRWEAHSTKSEVTSRAFSTLH